MRTWVFRILLIVLSLAPLAAEEAPRFGIDLESGMVWGKTSELVFGPKEGRNEGDPVSLLTWPVPPAYELGLTARLEWQAFTTRVSVRSAWPLVTGTMTDEDWRTQTYQGFLVYGRSQSESFLTTHGSVIVEQALRLLGVSVGWGGLYKSTQWEAWHGTARYEYSTVVEEAQFSGLILEYRQNWFIPFFSAGWTGTWDQWTLTPSVRVSPYTWCFDTDNHMLASKRVTYLDNLRGGWYAEGALELTFPPVWGLTAGLRGSFSMARGAVGETYAVTPTSTSLGTTVTVLPDANAAGGGFQEAAVSLFVRN